MILRRLLSLFIVIVAPLVQEQVARLPGPGGFKGGGTLTFSHKWESSGCTGTGTTCTVTTTATVSPGDFIYVQSVTTNLVKISSVSGLGTTCRDDFTRAGGTNFRHQNCYMLPADTSSFAAGTVTITYNATPGATHVIIWHATVAGSGLALDSTTEFSGTSGTSLTQAPFIISGTGGMAFEQASGSNNPSRCTVFSGTGWTNTSAPNDEVGGCSANNGSLSSNPTTPTLTFNSSHEGVVSGALFSFNPTPAVPYGVTDFSGSTNGGHPAADSQTTLQAGMFGLTGLNQSSNGILQVGVTDTGNALTYSTSAYRAFTTAPRFLASGATYSTPSTQIGMSWSSTAAAGKVAKLSYTFPSSNFMGDGSFVVSEWIQFQSFAVTDTLNTDILTSGGGQSQATVNFAADGTHLNITFETTAGCTNSGPATIVMDSNLGVWIEFELLFVPNTKAELIVFDASHTQLGKITRTPSGSCTLNGISGGFSLGESLGGTNTSGRTILFGPAKWGYIGNFTTEIVL